VNSFSAYPKVWNLGHPSVADILLDDVIVEEKVDGSQFSFGLDENGVLNIRSKGVVMNIDAPEGMFNKAVATVKELAAEGLLRAGWTYRAEFLQQPKHNALAYDRVPNKHLILFDITIGTETYLSRTGKEDEAARIGLEIVPLIFRGRITDIDFFKSLLKQTSILGGQQIEGVVVKNNDRFGKDGKPLFGKFVSPEFREVHKGEWKKANPLSQDIIDQLVAQYRTPARWAKAVQHLREAGKIQNMPQDIALLLPEVVRDIEAECIDKIKDTLFKWAMAKGLKRGVTGGLPEWYKASLLEQQFAPAAEPRNAAYTDAYTVHVDPAV
jgi:hypothetical protein